MDHLGCWVVPHNPLDLAFICYSVLLEEIVCIRLSRGVWVGIIEQILDSKENLLDSDRRLPTLLLVMDGQTDSTGRVDVGVEERWDEFA